MLVKRAHSTSHHTFLSDLRWKDKKRSTGRSCSYDGVSSDLAVSVTAILMGEGHLLQKLPGAVSGRVREPGLTTSKRRKTGNQMSI